MLVSAAKHPDIARETDDGLVAGEAIMGDRGQCCEATSQLSCTEHREVSAAAVSRD